MSALAAELYEELAQIPTIDAHEHLPPEKNRLHARRDFYDLFKHYCVGDLIAAGATPEDMAFFADQKQKLSTRWTRFKPFFQAIRSGGYARAALIVVHDLLGFPDLNDKTYMGVSAKLDEINTPGLYDRILREKCNLVACIDCWCYGQGPYPAYFHHLAPGPEVIDLNSRAALDRLGSRFDHSIHSLDDALVCMTRQVEQWRADPTVVGVKSAHAYNRSLAFSRVTRHDAETVFNRILTHEGHTLSAHEILPLQDHLLFELLARLDAVRLPMVFHTGLQAGNYNRIANANPLLLQLLFEEFPRAKIDLFHGGMPWVREIAVLAKYFPGVHLNMAWMHIINPAQARSALSEWLDMVPNTKIFGFGGDYHIVEKVYGHLKIARQNIAQVLAEKVTEGAFSRGEASRIARRLMLENPRRFYGLKLKGAPRQHTMPAGKRRAGVAK